MQRVPGGHELIFTNLLEHVANCNSLPTRVIDLNVTHAVVECLLVAGKLLEFQNLGHKVDTTQFFHVIK